MYGVLRAHLIGDMWEIQMEHVPLYSIDLSDASLTDNPVTDSPPPPLTNIRQSYCQPPSFLSKPQNPTASQKRAVHVYI